MRGIRYNYTWFVLRNCGIIRGWPLIRVATCRGTTVLEDMREISVSHFYKMYGLN